MVEFHFIQSARDFIAELYDFHFFESDAECLEFIYSLLAENKNLFLLQSVWKVVYAVQIQRRVSRKLLTNGQHPLYCLVDAIPGLSTVNYIIGRITAVSMLMDCII